MTRMVSLAMVVSAALLSVPAGASAGESGGGARIDSVLAGDTMGGQAVQCVEQPNRVRLCRGDIGGPDGSDLRLRSFDGTPLSVYVTLPPVPKSGEDGRFPLIVQSHGWGAVPKGPDDSQYGGPTATQWAEKGYAVMQLTARGWGNSCGTVASRQVDADACAKGYIRLDDVRYEARDVQHGIGVLVDDGVVDADRIGLTGESYGSGVSLEVATLRDRVMDPDGTLHRWKSPDGTALHVAAAVPLFGWSDMFYSLIPNGRTLDSQVVGPTTDLSPVGVSKQSISSGLFLVGDSSGYIAPAGADPQADIRTWFQAMGAGEPYGDKLEDIAELNVGYHSPYYLLSGANGVERRPPAPLLMVAGFTDAVFPVDEALRYYNLNRELYPDRPIALHFYDGGHQRAQNKPADGPPLTERIEAFFDHHLRGNGPAPSAGVTALTQTCPMTEPSGGPFHAETWEALHPGEVRYRAAADQSVQSDAGDPAVAKALDPVLGGLACTTVPATDQGAGVATYRLPTPSGKGYTLLGAPTVTADLDVNGTGAFLAARLLDVDPTTNTATLIARGEYRIDPNSPDGPVTFQLHANAWHFAPGHIPKLELLGQDQPYLRPSNGTFTITVSNLDLRLPVHETPGKPDTPTEVRRFTPISSTSTGSGDTGGSGQKIADNTADNDDRTPTWIILAVVAVVVIGAGLAVAARSRRRRQRAADSNDSTD